MQPAVFVHMVLWNSASTHGYTCLSKVVKSVLSQAGFELGSNLTFLISDNASSDQALEQLRAEFSDSGICFQQLSHNFGFSGAHNIGAVQFLKSSAQYLLLLNPDCRLENNFLTTLVQSLEQSKSDLATPRLLRADDKLEPMQPAILDACGMVLTNSLRHFDRGSGEKAQGAYLTSEIMFGGSGACLLLSRTAIEALSLPQLAYSAAQEQVHPDLKFLPKERIDLFDEAFFAYREDADLCWRANLIGLKCLYVPTAIGYHRRVVTPERRAILAPELNRHSVRNRFLLQLNNYHFQKFPTAFLLGVIVRNIVVVFGVLFAERSSFAGLMDVFKLFKRALSRRRYINSIVQK